MGTTVKSKKQDNRNEKRSVTIPSLRSGTHAKVTKSITPMLATLSASAFTQEGWIFEPKWDGYRAIAELDKGEVRLYSRNGISFNQLYPEVVSALEKLQLDAVFDGEVVVVNREGRPDFQKLQQYGSRDKAFIRFIVFDCLSLNGKSIVDLPLIERKRILSDVFPKNSQIILYSDHVETNGEDFFSRMKELDLEGMIAKRSDSRYETGKRSKNWLKIKNHNTQETVIVGYTPPKGSRPYFGSLILATKSNGEFKYAGNTGTGFTHRTLKELYQNLQLLKTNTSPFKNKIPLESKVTWIEPKLVCQIKYTELTRDGIMRHPVYMGLRVDKSAKDEIHLDTPAKPSKVKKDTGSDVLELDGQSVTITHKDKIYWAKEKITKADVIDYYYSIHQFILPYFFDRPQSLRRNPNGASERGFFQKEAGKGTPTWIKTESIYAESSDRDINYIICNDTATLAYLNNIACIEFNTWNSKISNLDQPDYLIIDLDPSEANSFNEVIECALTLKSIFDDVGCKSFCKTSGSKGLHIYVPLGAQYSYDEARNFAQITAELIVKTIPSLATTERALKKRNGKIYIDFEQNKKAQTVASVYSLRPRPGAPVSTPLQWNEVGKGLSPLDFTIRTIPSRLQKQGDLFKSVLTESTDLNLCQKKLMRLI